MKIITININKGGTGKSTFSYNFSKWLSSIKHKKVLLIDGDSSCNLTYSFYLTYLTLLLFPKYLLEIDDVFLALCELSMSVRSVNFPEFIFWCVFFGGPIF